MDTEKTAPAPESGAHFLDYWRIIRIRKTVILSVFLLVVLTATVVTIYLPKGYTSTARLMVQRDSTDIQVDGMANNGVNYDPFFLQTQSELIQSEKILDPVITREGLIEKWAKKDGSRQTLPEVRKQLRYQLALHTLRNTSLIDISVRSSDTAEAEAIANGIAEEYTNYRSITQKEQSETGIGVLTNLLIAQEAKIEQQEKLVTEMRVTNSIIDVDANNSSSAATMDDDEIRHYLSVKIEAEVSYAKEKNSLDKLESLKDSTNELRQVILTIRPDDSLSTLMQQFTSAQSAYVNAKSIYGDKSPDLEKPRELEADISKRIDDRVYGLMEGLKTDVQALTNQVATCEEHLEAARTNSLARARKNMPYFLEKGKLDEYKYYRNMLQESINKETEVLRLPKTKVAEIIEHAYASKIPTSPNEPVNIALGIIFGLALGVGLAFFIEYLDTSVKTIDDIERTLQAPVLGVIPQNIGYLHEEGVEGPHSEAYRVLRTNLMFSRKDDTKNSAAVVSAGAGEGKSTTVFNLATVFAQSGQRTLIVDSDLRRPTIHKILKASNNIGLTNYLLKQNTLEQVIQTSGIPNLDFMASGKLPGSSLGVLNSTQMRTLITELKKRYDWVFFDSPPIMGVSDASILASEVDMTIQVIQYRRYPQPMNVRAKQMIEKVGGNLAGIVLNNINVSQDESYYYYSGYYYDYYSKNEDQNPTEENGATNGSSGGKSRLDIKSKY